MAKQRTYKCKLCDSTKCDGTIFTEYESFHKATLTKEAYTTIEQRFFCCEDHKNKYEKRVKEYKELCDYINDLYIANGYKKENIPWKILTAQIQQILDNEKEITHYSQYLYILKYMVEILEMNLFDDRFDGSILNLLPFYIQEGISFCLKCKDIRESVKGFDFSDDIRVVRVSGNRDKKIDEETFD